jgi:uncharacterized integral membrane protein
MASSISPRLPIRDPLHQELVSSTAATFNYALLTYLISVLIFIITILLLAVDFYYLKNIAGRRLVGLRWWNEVNPQTGESHWVFESSDPSIKVINATDSRFFWLALYSQPLLWVVLAVLAIFRMHPIWLTLVGMLLTHIGNYMGLIGK